MGGQNAADILLPRSSASMEIYSPPYLFKSPRPQILTNPDTIHYQERFCVEVNRSITKACLIGIGSNTHHFDYGQRYIELMVLSPGDCGTGSVELLAPTPTMAPEGYYMLFVMNNRGPSKAKFVKLTHP